MKKLVYIEWADAITPTEGWKTEDETLRWAKEEDYWVSQVGWILEENKKYILLAAQMNTSKAETVANQYGHIIKIPKTWIRVRKLIKIP